MVHIFVQGDYKYNDELAMVFMSCNLIGGKLISFVIRNKFLISNGSVKT